ncbi:glyceraldehyde 3-phosphate dehydrogenase [Algoriphagus ratkowskyi]|uniref:Glyceraldehyde-3-phosphate dehydrogenase n=1 Tax=Algoriphagus ratkowskyi TaxID=57028 RepID=A0A2W7S166_9BACT|nr:type I glyceraldehyde-3-phosphate dehydrogenase [Algoriphagus ratkowskyi]PZX56875.1 glyceraldehyde 3-phosphate dehydrogenase [Algoriphagus ratkowskyi]TXD79789.1 type I glyceraldehyde-3-phosphate dehydrogenase [Algoriphagus ratkowskyi]
MKPANEIRIAINGFGRIGRYTAKLILENSGLNLVAINDLADQEAISHLLKYDSIHGKSEHKIELQGTILKVGKHDIQLFGEADPEKLPWLDLNIDLVIECTGRFTDRSGAEKHLIAGAKKVIISAPSLDPTIKMIVLGVNDSILTGNERIVSNASCTTNCLAPMVKVLDDNFGVVKGFASTVHSYTNDQNLHDAPHRDLRRARAAAYSIIPTSTNAGKALDVVLPELAGRIEASAMRVPVPDGSLTDMIVELKQEVTEDQINSAFRQAGAGYLKGLIEVEDSPIVSIDIIGNPHSCIIDSALTSAKGKMIKLVGWYDNEAGYANRLVDLARLISKK